MVLDITKKGSLNYTLCGFLVFWLTPCLGWQLTRMKHFNKEVELSVRTLIFYGVYHIIIVYTELFTAKGTCLHTTGVDYLYNWCQKSCLHSISSDEQKQINLSTVMNHLHHDYMQVIASHPWPFNHLIQYIIYNILDL